MSKQPEGFIENSNGIPLISTIPISLYINADGWGGSFELPHGANTIQLLAGTHTLRLADGRHGNIVVQPFNLANGRPKIITFVGSRELHPAEAPKPKAP